MTQPLHRILVEWESGAFVSSLSPTFQADLLELVAQYGRPSKVEFRAADEGWVEDKTDYSKPGDDEILCIKCSEPYPIALECPDRLCNVCREDAMVAQATNDDGTLTDAWGKTWELVDEPEPPA